MLTVPYIPSKQYIGARYLPIIVGDWDITKEYEPLMVVYYNGASYTSKTYIPAGIDISNTTYWALSADYNAQVAAYRAEVLALAEKVAKKIYYIDIPVCPRHRFTLPYASTPCPWAWARVT